MTNTDDPGCERLLEKRTIPGTEIWLVPNRPHPLILMPARSPSGSSRQNDFASQSLSVTLSKNLPPTNSVLDLPKLKTLKCTKFARPEAPIHSASG